MNAGAQVQMLDECRLHLQHGPIDLIIEAFGRDRQHALRAADARFATVLDELVAELPILRAPLTEVRPTGAVAKRMEAAVAPFADRFVTPMAAVAGAVADAVLAAMLEGNRLQKAYVNNGGDIAFWLAEAQVLTAAIHSDGDAGRVRLTWDQPGRGLASSGWRGRSHSLGIADAVTVVAPNAAMADAAATLIANAVDLPGHAHIQRVAARAVSPDSDLGDRLVTTKVGELTPGEVAQALAAGKDCADQMYAQGLITAAALFLAGEVVLVGGMDLTEGVEDARLQIA